MPAGDYTVDDEATPNVKVIFAGPLSVAPGPGGTGSRDLRFGDGDDNVWMTIAQNGNVGISRAPTSNKLEVEGNASKSVAGSWLANSDARIKTDVTEVQEALDLIDRVRLVQFRYTDEYRKRHPSIEDRPYMNVIAQEFAEVFPDYVRGSGEVLADGAEILQVDTYPLTIYSVAAVQELNRHLKQKEAENDTLRAENDVRIKQLLAEKDAQIAELRARLEAVELLIRTVPGRMKGVSDDEVQD